MVKNIVKNIVKDIVKNIKTKVVLYILVLATSGFGKSIEMKSTNSGALIAVSMTSTTGVLLDQFPQSIKNRVIKDYLYKSESFWTARARMQVETTLYRLVYRNSFYKNKGRLPLPPKQFWTITVSKPQVFQIDSHQIIGVDYKFSSTLLTAADSISAAEPQLTVLGGRWDERFILPVDPELLLERTGFSCIDEMNLPPNSVDSENAKIFYEDRKSVV